MPDNKLLKAALWYREKMDYSIIPVIPGDKKPLVKWEQFQKQKPTPEQIKEWWAKNPNANIGIITGKINNLCVVDLDKYAKDYSEEITSECFPDSIITPTANSPRGGQHLYFSYEEGMTISARQLPGIDFRGEGGFIIAPPSVNGNGKKYVWVENLEIYKTPTVQLPLTYINKLKEYIYMTVTVKRDNGVTSVTMRDIWKEGMRDDNLFHVAHCLTMTKNSEDYIRQTLMAITKSWGEQDETWINAKVQSAMSRAERKDRNIQAEVDAFIGVTNGDFSVTQCDKELGCVTPRDMAAVRKAISRRKDTTVEKVGTKDGWWRRIDTEIEYFDFNEEEGKEFPILLPFGLHDLVHIYEGNIILCSGEFNSGKTLFALSGLVMNKNRMPIRYMSSEMKVPEIKGRLKWFGLDKECWMPDDNCRYLPLKNNLNAALLPDGLNIIDYLEFPEGDYTRSAEYMKQIHDKLNKGIALVCVQHKTGQRFPRSGDLILEKPRLAFSLKKVDENKGDVIGVAEIIKAKHPKIGKMDGKKLKFEIINNGSRFNTLIDWGYWRI